MNRDIEMGKVYRPIGESRQPEGEIETDGLPLLKILERSFKILEKRDINDVVILWALTGLNYTAVKVLKMLSQNALTVLEISNRIGKSRSWVQKLLIKLFRYGLIERTWMSSQQKYLYNIPSKRKLFDTLKSIVDTIYKEIIVLI